MSRIMKICLLLASISLAACEEWTFVPQSLNVEAGINHKLKLIYDKDNLADSGFVYGACAFNEYSPKSKCHLFMESDEAVGTSSHVRSCDFDLSIPRNSVVKRIVYLDNDAAAIVTQKYFLSLFRDFDSRITIVRFSDCRWTTVELGYDVNYGRIAIPFNNTFDLIGIAACEDGENCRMTMDFNGTIVAKARRWTASSMELYAAVHSPVEGSLVVSSCKDYSKAYRVLRVCAVSDDGDVVNVLREYPVDSRYFLEDGVAYSLTRRLLSVCAASNLTATCAQFDLNGRLKFEVSIDAVGGPASLRTMKIFNLSEGGFLFLYTDGSASDSTVFATKVNFLGQRFQTLRLTRFTGTEILEKMHFFVNEKKEYCLSQPSLPEPKFITSGKVTLEIVCFKQHEIPILVVEVGASQ